MSDKKTNDWRGSGASIICTECGNKRHITQICMARHTQINHVDLNVEPHTGHYRTPLRLNCMRPVDHRGIHHTRCEVCQGRERKKGSQS